MYAVIWPRLSLILVMPIAAWTALVPYWRRRLTGALAAIYGVASVAGGATVGLIINFLLLK